MKKIFVFLLICGIAASASAEFRWVVDTTISTNVYGAIIPTGQHAEQFITHYVSGAKVRNNGTMFTEANYALLGLLPRKSTLLYLPLNAPNLFNGAYIPFSQSWFKPSVSAGGMPNDSEWRSLGLQGFSWTEGSGFGLTMLWSGNNIESFVKFDGGRIMNILMNEPFPRKRDGDTPNPGDRGLTSLGNFLDNFFISEYWIRANTNYIMALFGNRGGSGRTDDFQEHTDWIPTPVRIDGFGVNVPSPEGPISATEGHRNLHNIGAKDPLFGFRNGSWNTYDFSSYVVAELKMQNMIPEIPFPLFVGFGLDFDPGIFKVITPGVDYYYNSIDEAELGSTRVGGSIRVSGEALFGKVNFDVAYKLRGGSRSNDDTWDPEANPYGITQPDGEGFMTHVIGAYFTTPNLVPDLGVGLGYTALFRTFEDYLINPRDEDQYLMKTTSPFFSGIDLFLRYTGVQDLRLTFKTNISFANVPGAVRNEDGNPLYPFTRRYGIDGLPHTDPFYSQKWFALYNSLAARLLITGRFLLNLEVISHLGIITENNSDPDRTGTYALAGLDGWGTRVRTKHTISGAIYAVYKFSSNIDLQMGISVYSEQAFTKLSGFPDDGSLSEFAPASFHAGGVGISFPIKMKLVL